MGFARKIKRKQFVQEKKALQKIARYKRRFWYVRSLTHKIEDITYTIRQDKDFNLILSDDKGIIGQTKAKFGVPDKMMIDFVEHFHKLQKEREVKAAEENEETTEETNVDQASKTQEDI